MTIPYVTGDQLKNAADYLASTKEQGGCYHWKVCSQGDKDIAIVLGWTNGFDKNDPDKDKYQDDTWRLAVKVGYQPSNSIMQCDYDVDFNLPYWPENGDVLDECEYCIYETTDFGILAKDINSNVNWVIKHWKELGHD